MIVAFRFWLFLRIHYLLPEIVEITDINKVSDLLRVPYTKTVDNQNGLHS